ncbi:MAG: chorismate synthase [Clostridia bacterium]|nr:chorismate synthase [Clostridia bacterium]
MSSMIGTNLRLSLFGQSRGPAVGIVMDGFPAGMEIDTEALRALLARRAPGTGPLVSSRREADEPEILSGVLNGHTTGQPLCVVIRNTDPGDDCGPLDLPRPSHADLPAHIRYHGAEDHRGGGHASGRLTAPLVFAGGLCMQYLEKHGIGIYAHIARLGALTDDPLDPARPEDLRRLKDMRLPVLRSGLDAEMEKTILSAAAAGDSVGGEIECTVTGLPAGIGEPFFDSVESTLSRLLFSVPAVKGVSFGEGFGFAGMTGLESNDPWVPRGGKIVPETNHAGGVLGGISTGAPIIFRCCVRAAPSIRLPQRTVSLQSGKEAVVAFSGRNDPCILPRAVPVIESAAAIGILDLFLAPRP